MKSNCPPAKILCVDDDPIARVMYRMVLSRAGYACEFACDGKAALSAVRAAPEKFALVITDIQMPGMDGWSLVQHLVQMSFAGKILVVSASVAAAPETGPPHGAIDQVHTKPVTAHRLLSTVQALLGGTSGLPGLLSTDGFSQL